MRKAKSNGGLTRGRMRNESSVKVWAGTFSHLKLLGDLMEEMIGGKRSKRTHTDLGAKRLEKDSQHVKLISAWFSTHNPFIEVKDPNTITSLSSGVITTDKSIVNCDDAVRIGHEMQKDLDNESPVKSMKTAKKCKNLAELQKKVKVGDKRIYIEKTLLFNRLIFMAERDEGIEHMFKFELNPVPTSLFTMDRMMRKPKKHEFGKMLKETATILDVDINSKMHVVDGGWLLHQVKWSSGATIKTIVDTNVRYVDNKFKDATVVFDGYGEESSTKDHEHMRRMAGKKVSPDMRVTPELTISCDREVFLANEKNKGALIMMISAEMASHNITVRQAKDDGDTLIVRSAMDLVASVKSPVVVVAQDTDILILLCYHRPIHCTNFYLQADFGGLYDISSIHIGDKEEFLFKYGWSGNDTVSCIHGHTKCALYKCRFPASVITAFTSPTSTDSIIRTAGLKAMQITYGCGDTPLEKSRYMKFKKQAAKGKIDPDRLPPTEDATAQHSLRVHLQVVVWKHLDTSILDPKGRGWELDSNRKLRPKMLSVGIAPDNLLKVICCNCKEGERQCQTMRCSCMKARMSCVSACGVCCGHCDNGTDSIDAEEEIGSDEEETD
uniref:uncharacterized protein n=1 Tax=Myxine glutinosa TaxID=7769 RepID=UPI00358F1FFC